MDGQTWGVEHNARRPLLSFGRALFAAVVLSCVVLLPREVRAQEGGTVETYVLSARRLYDDLENERALEQISRAKRFSTGVADDALLSLYEGIILADLSRSNASDAAFKAALFLQPDAKLPFKVSPKVELRFEAMRELVKRELEALDAQRRGVTGQPPEGAQPAGVAQPSQDAPVSSTTEALNPTHVQPDLGGPQAAPVTVTSPLPPMNQVSASGGLRGRAWLPATIGGVLLAGGGVSYAISRRERSRLRDNDASLGTLQDVQRSASRGRTYQTVAIGLASAGVVGLGISAGMYLLGGPPAPEKARLGMSTDGTSAFVFGRWP